MKKKVGAINLNTVVLYTMQYKEMHLSMDASFATIILLRMEVQAQVEQFITMVIWF